MKVKELIEELKKCNPDDIVMYDFENAFTNDNLSECTTCKNGTNANLIALLKMWRLVQGRSKVLYFCVKLYLGIKRIGRTFYALFSVIWWLVWV